MSQTLISFDEACDVIAGRRLRAFTEQEITSVDILHNQIRTRALTAGIMSAWIFAQEGNKQVEKDGDTLTLVAVDGKRVRLQVCDPPFDPGQSFTPEEAARAALAQPDPFDALARIVKTNIQESASGFSAKVVQAFEDLMGQMFDPGGSWESPSEAAAAIVAQPKPLEALMQTIRANIEVEEFGFASELVLEFETLYDDEARSKDN